MDQATTQYEYACVLSMCSMSRGSRQVGVVSSEGASATNGAKSKEVKSSIVEIRSQGDAKFAMFC